MYCPEDGVQARGNASGRNEALMKPKNSPVPASDEVKRSPAVRSPISHLSRDKFAELRGHLVAILLEDPDKGKVIASAVLDLERPERPRAAIREQIAASPYSSRMYQVCQILDIDSQD